MSGGFIPVEKVPAMPVGLLQLQWTVCGWPRLSVKNIAYKSGILNSQKIYDKINQSLANRLSLSA